MTVLRGIGGIDGNHLTSGTFSLLREDGSEHGPRGISDALGETVIAKHILDVEFLDGNHAESVDNAPGGLVGEIMAAVANALMDTRQNLVGFLSRRASFLGFGLLSASLRQCLLVTAEEARIFNELAAGQGHERIQSRVKSNGFFGKRQWLNFTLTGKAYEPFFAVPADSAGFNSTVNRTMDFRLDLNRSAEQRQPNRSIANLEPALRIGDAVVLTFALQAGIARGFACF